MLIVNRTAKSFFVYRNHDNDFMQIIKELITPPDDTTKLSHWKKSDIIIICLDHLYDYIATYENYNQLIFEADIDAMAATVAKKKTKDKKTMHAL